MAEYDPLVKKDGGGNFECNPFIRMVEPRMKAYIEESSLTREH
jgi:hypothetical protein